MPTRKALQTLTPSLLTADVDVDYIRCEKNLLQMGFFGANDTRQSTRRIEQTVTRDNVRTRVTAELRSSELLGLPSTPDQEKFYAFMKIAGEQRAKQGGKLMNPIRFTAYQMIEELDKSHGGKNYHEIALWGKRMADTTITSEKVIYLALRKKYADQTIHVFRSFRREGESTLDGKKRNETYEVVLEDWLLENLNQSWVVPEDFNAYKKLTRRMAKGIFGYLHIWFHATHLAYMEKDYSDLCVLLNVPAYRHLSKIHEKMGPSLDELIKIQYLSRWEVHEMVTKDGYKLKLWPGEELNRALAVTQKRQLPKDSAAHETPTDAQQEAIGILIARGVAPAKALELATRFDPPTVIDQAEYIRSQKARDTRGRIRSESALLIHSIENNYPVPADFVTTRRQQAISEQENKRRQAERERQQREFEYQEWRDAVVQEELTSRYPGAHLDQKIAQIVSQRQKTDSYFQRVNSQQRQTLALQLLRKELREEMQLPSLDQWIESTQQPNLFPSSASVN